MNSWQSAMIKGNECFDSHNWLEAQRYYNQAIELLDLLWQKQNDSVEAMQGWVCGYHNLAATFEQQGQMDRAAQCLLHAHFTIVERANNKQYPDAAQSNALRMSSITYKSIIEFKNKHTYYSDCFDNLTPAQAQLGTQIVPAQASIH